MVGNLLVLGMMFVGVVSNFLFEIICLIFNVFCLGQSSQINLEILVVLQFDLIIGVVWEMKGIYNKLLAIVFIVVFEM